jgi:hypothetical protein
VNNLQKLLEQAARSGKRPAWCDPHNPPQQTMRLRTVREANQQTARNTIDRNRPTLDAVQGLLRDFGVDQDTIQRVLTHLLQWLAQEDPLGFLRSLQDGQLRELLGEIAPVVAQWLGENLGSFGGGSARKRRGARTVRTTRLPTPTLGSIVLSNAPGLIRLGLGVIGQGTNFSAAGPFPSPGLPAGGEPGTAPDFSTGTIELPPSDNVPAPGTPIAAPPISGPGVEGANVEELP